MYWAHWPSARWWRGPCAVSGETPSEAERIDAIVAIAQKTEEVGLDVFAIGEHHNPPFFSSSPTTLLAYIAATTKKLIVTTSTTLITTNDPVRIAEEYAMLQHLSKGRMDLMLGRGNTAPVYPWFGQDIRQSLPLALENYNLLHRLRIGTIQKELETLVGKVQKLTQKLSELLEVDVAVTAAAPGRYSKAQNLALQIQGLEERVFSMEMEGVPAAGTVDLMDSIATGDEVALAVLSSESACPSAESVRQWFADCETAAGQPFGDHQRRVYLLWRDGAIDREQSYIQVGDFEQSSGASSAYAGRPIMDSRTGIFRAGKPTPTILGAAGTPPAPERPRGLSQFRDAGYGSGWSRGPLPPRQPEEERP